MKRRSFNTSLLTALTVPALGGIHTLASAQTPRWSLVADLAECCSCEIPCSCNFGRPTELRCDGNRLIQIREGQFEGENLAGINFLVTFLMGNWTRIHIDESMSSAQYAAFEKMFPVAFAGFDRLARNKARVPLSISRTDSTISFSVPESRVEMKLMAGLDDSPIMINGLPNPAYHDYVQYESVVHRHESTDSSWSYEGTNGFTSVMRASG